MKARIAVALVVGAAYAISYALAGHLLPGLVGGVLAALLLFLAIDRFERQTAARRARRRE